MKGYNVNDSDAVYDFFGGTKYTNKVLDQSTWKDNHGFPESVDGFDQNSKVKITKFFGGDKKEYIKLEIKGEYNGREGYFEYIKDENGMINHRLFVPIKKN